MSGQNAAFIDISNRIYERAPWFLLYIIGVTVHRALDGLPLDS